MSWKVGPVLPIVNGLTTDAWFTGIKGLPLELKIGDPTSSSVNNLVMAASIALQPMIILNAHTKASSEVYFMVCSSPVHTDDILHLSYSLHITISFIPEMKQI